MKRLLVGVNASYAHTNLAVRMLSAACGVPWKEYNVNPPATEVLRDLYEQKPRVAAFSCYIWNIEYVLRLAADLKQLLPNMLIVLGGPEVSFHAREMMEENPFVDAVVCGEAEESLPALFTALDNEGALPEGVLLRRDGVILGSAQFQTVARWRCEPFYGEEYDPHKITYYESTRGCPFSCAYCLSGTKAAGLREAPLETVLADIDTFVKQGVRLVKFTDRTFNANSDRAKRIVRHIAQTRGKTCFHFEAGLDLFDGEWMDLLRRVPVGRIQLEAGVQTCNEASLAAVCRKTDLERLLENARAILGMGNIHLHLDLIAGLPHDSLKTFAESFDRLFMLRPDHLQLGFLKLLKGAALRGEAGRYGIRYRYYPPYEVLETADMSAGDLFLLKDIARLVERYWNSGRAKRMLVCLTDNCAARPLELFAGLAAYCAKAGYATRQPGATAQYELLAGYAVEVAGQGRRTELMRLLREDYHAAGIKARLPKAFEE